MTAKTSLTDRWFGRTDLERVERYITFSFHLMFWFPLLFSVMSLAGLGRDAFRSPALGLTVVVWNGANVVAALQARRLLRPALEEYLGGDRLPRGRMLGLIVATLVACSAAFVTLVVFDDARGRSTPVLWWVVISSTALLLVLGLLMRETLTILAVTGVLSVLGFGVELAIHGDAVLAVTFAFLVAFWLGIAILTSRLSGWLLRVVHELDRARSTAGRLAVAEERLRFSRDLHDVVGRSLSSVSLKTQLASALVTRGRGDDAVAELDSVRELVAQAQEEMRAVVAGYRRVDLDAEISAARALLTSAGADVRVVGEGAWLESVDPRVREALAWAVREGSTNVVRHARPSWTRLTLGRDGEHVYLTVVNDGAGGAGLDDEAHRTGASARSGTGLAGLDGRVEVLGGTVEAARESDVFTLIVRVPAVPERDGEWADEH